MSSRMSPEDKAKIARMVAMLDGHPDTLREELRRSPFEDAPAVVFEVRPAPEVQLRPVVKNHGPKPWSKKAKRRRL